MQSIEIFNILVYRNINIQYKSIFIKYFIKLSLLCLASAWHTESWLAIKQGF